MRFLLAVAAVIWDALLRTAKRCGAPGSGPKAMTG
jgi:hypothetical protein